MRLPSTTLLCVLLLAPLAAHADDADLRICTDEADAVLAILAARRQGTGPTEAQWSAVFDSEGYRRLRDRETSMKRPFEEDAFRGFALSDSLLEQEAALRETLARWRHLDFRSSARRVSAYLPAGAEIRATIYFVIKPRSNDFVFDLGGDPAVFFHLDPEVAPAKLENTIAHELHHVGVHTVLGESGPWKEGEVSPSLDRARGYVGAFGEGFAMLAAAGGPDVHPHAVSPEAERARWDRDMGDFAADLAEVDAFLADLATGRIDLDEARRRAMSTFWGDAQGAWYTVGYRMAVLIEETFGRERLLECMEDLSRLLPTYNDAAIARRRAGGEELPLWSDALLATLNGPATDR